jgi:hypothetical protein
MAAPETAFERHYSVEELAELWHLSEDFVRRLFLKEPGVVVFWRQRPGRRVYRTLRIPQSVAFHVHQRMTIQREDPTDVDPRVGVVRRIRRAPGQI